MQRSAVFGSRSPVRGPPRPLCAELVHVLPLGSCPFAAVNSLAVEVPGVSLGGCDLLVDGVWVGLLVLDSVEVLAVEVGEGCAVAGVAEERARTAHTRVRQLVRREAADHLVRRLTSPIYLALIRAEVKWKKVMRWTNALRALKIHFGDRIPD